MRIRQLQKKTIIRGVIILSFIIALGSVVVIYANLSEQYTAKKNLLENEIRKLERNIQNINAQDIEFAKSISYWEALRDNQKELTKPKITSAKDIIDKLAKKHNIKLSKFIITKPEKTKKIKSSNNIDIFVSNIQVDIGAIKDADIYNFIYELRESILGVINIKSLNLVKSDNKINKIIIEQIANGHNPDIISGNIELLWYGLQYNEQNSK